MSVPGDPQGVFPVLWLSYTMAAVVHHKQVATMRSVMFSDEPGHFGVQHHLRLLVLIVQRQHPRAKPKLLAEKFVELVALLHKSAETARTDCR